MAHNIKIGKYTLLLLESVSIVRSVEALADTAEIVLPGTVHNEAVDVEGKISVGDAVSIELGYGKNLRTEFEGFVSRIGTDGGSVKVECEDALWLFRKAVADKEYKGADVKTILSDICHQCGGLALECDYSFTYEKFTVHNATGYDVLRKVQDEVRPNIYLKGMTLHVHPQCAEVFGSATYDFGGNIERGGTSLEYRRADDRRVLVVVEGEKSDGTKVTAEAGVSGGDRVTLRVPGATDASSLEKVAEQVLSERCYTGYSGDIQGWLVPYCDAGYKVAIRDKDYEYKEGTYYVTAVETSYGRSGGVRRVTLGKRLK